MKFFHLSDLHLGKRLNDFSLIDDQRAVLNQILIQTDVQSPDGILIAGDIYDKSVPSAEAVGLFDEFLASLARRKIKTFIISGNHDSAERIAFGSKIMSSSGIYLSPVYNGNITPITVSDEHGELNVYLMPFLKPAHVRRFFEDSEIVSYTDAIRTVIDQMNIDTAKRNVLVAHQFVTGASASGSEEEILSVGGSDNVDGGVFNALDYVALGHIHGSQDCSNPKIRYSGTPLKYSFSEINHKKTITMVELGKKGEELKISTIPLVPERDMKEIRGDFDRLMSPDFYSGTTYQDDYMKIVLTDENDIPDAVAKLRRIYKNLMRIEYDNSRTRAILTDASVQDVENKSTLQLFCEFYLSQNGMEMTDDQLSYVKDLIEKMEGGNE